MRFFFFFLSGILAIFSFFWGPAAKKGGGETRALWKKGRGGLFGQKKTKTPNKNFFFIFIGFLEAEIFFFSKKAPIFFRGKKKKKS